MFVGNEGKIKKGNKLILFLINETINVWNSQYVQSIPHPKRMSLFLANTDRISMRKNIFQHFFNIILTTVLQTARFGRSVDRE